DLGTLGGSTSTAAGINNLGQVVGTSYIEGDSTQHAFLWQNGGMSDLGTLPEGTFSSATAINNAGQVVGTADSGVPFLWQNGTMTALDISWDDSGYASAINDAGQVVGSVTGSQFFGVYTDAALWDNGAFTDLGSYGWPDSSASGINNLG